MVRAISGRRPQRGFSLIELLVVVIIIGIVAALAIPTMSVARSDRRAYDDAGAIVQLFRSARTRAIARGSAVLIAVSANPPTTPVTLLMYEAVSTNPGGAANAALPARTPVASCKAPTSWVAAANMLLVDSLYLSGPFEASAGIQTTMWIYASPTASAAAQIQNASICWTPLGRSYIAPVAPAVNIFDGMLPTVSPLELRVQRTNGGTIRSVLVPPNGMARLFSHG